MVIPMQTTNGTPNCYATALSRPDLGMLKPGGLALARGDLDRRTYDVLWDNRKNNLRAFMGACMSGMGFDGLKLMTCHPDLPANVREHYLVAAFARADKGSLDFHYAFSPLGTDAWHHASLVQYCPDDPPFTVIEDIRAPRAMTDTGLMGYEFLILARVPAEIYALDLKAVVAPTCCIA